jgi:hypothetical protein
MKVTNTNQPRRRSTLTLAKRRADRLAVFLAMSPHVASRDIDMFPYGSSGPACYDPKKIYVRAECDEKLVRKAVELREAGATYVMVHRKSVSGRFPIKQMTVLGFRTRRMDLHFNYELKA